MEKISRSFVKAFTWRALATLTTFGLVFVVSGSFTLALSVGLLDVIVKLLVYVFHERVWDKVKWGKKSGRVLWFTGLSGAGKTTIVNLLKPVLEKRGENVVVLDGDQIREIFPNTGFTKKERDAHVKRVGYMATLMAKSGATVLCALISPYDAPRKEVREVAGDLFTLIWVYAPIESCINRDPKGLYKKALAGEIKNFTGVSQKYEEPEDYDIRIDTVLMKEEEVINRLKKIV